MSDHLYEDGASGSRSGLQTHSVLRRRIVFATEYRQEQLEMPGLQVSDAIVDRRIFSAEVGPLRFTSISTSISISHRNIFIYN